jgi:hypothetical protein
MNEVTITFNEEQLRVLNDALVQLSYRVAAPVINHINVQIQRQLSIKAEQSKSPASTSIGYDENGIEL